MTQPQAMEHTRYFARSALLSRNQPASLHCMTAAMRGSLFSVLAALALTTATARSSPRRPVVGVPVLGGRPVERFVVERWILGGKERGYRPGTVVYNLKVPPNIFAPTIEDDAGVFYQAANPFQVVDTVVIGGIYVKKAQPAEIYLFFGNAEGSGRNVSISPKPLPPEIVRKLRVAKVQRK